MGLCIFSGILNFKSTIEKAPSIPARSFFLVYGGERGIRTLGRVSPTLDFQSLLVGL